MYSNNAPDLLRFVFVGGVGRSGTSLVQKILDLHPAVYGGPELGILPDLMTAYRRLRGDIERGKLSVLLSVEAAERRFRDFIHSLFVDRVSKSGEKIVSEKTPLNLTAFDTLADVFPEARFVWVIRDPRDVLVSMREVRKRSVERGRRVSLGRWLHHDLEDIQKFLEAGEAFRRKHQDRLHIVYYEELVRSPESIARTLAEFLDLTFDERMLHTERRTDISKAIAQVEDSYGIFYDNETFDRPIDDSRVGKWKQKLGPWSRKAIEATLGSGHFPSLEPYDITEAKWPWPSLYSGWARVAALLRVLAR